MPKNQRTFTREFQIEAVQPVQTSQKPLTQISRDLGIADSRLHHWCNLFSEQGEQAFLGSGHHSAQEPNSKWVNDLLPSKSWGSR